MESEGKGKESEEVRESKRVRKREIKWASGWEWVKERAWEK